MNDSDVIFASRSPLVCHVFALASVYTTMMIGWWQDKNYR